MIIQAVGDYKMTKEEYKTIYAYLLDNCPENEKYFEKDKNGNYTGKFKNAADCKIHLINKIFETRVKCEQYDIVANGEGNEKEKIDTVYSSSLQSLLVFYNVSQGNKICIGEYEFDEVLFEYRNTVINRPSSIDVVLVDNSKRAIAFIESKFLEIIRDSTKDEKNKTADRKVVGISYFDAKNPHGYNLSLHLEQEELDLMGITYPKGLYLDSVWGQSHLKQSVKRLKDNKYVYADGIKQILSHIIGIQSFKRGESEYLDDPIPDHQRFEKVIYVELYNDFPNLKKDVKETKIEDFIEHCKVVKKVLTENHKGLIDEFVILSYQELFAENHYYDISPKVTNYFRIK